MTSLNGHEYVDLGLSVKWATCNVGASKPSDYGNYYTWGNTNYDDNNSVPYGKSMNDIGGTQYDVAHTNWGGRWRLPARAEFQELIDKCKWKWTKVDGHNGYKVTGPNGKSIFLPAAGSRGSLLEVGSGGSYWSSTRSSDVYSAWVLLFDDGDHYMIGCNRFCEQPIRPVLE